MNIKHLIQINSSSFKVNYKLILLSILKKSRLLIKYLRKMDYSLLTLILNYK